MDKKKIICAALISVMALSLAACGNKKVDYGMNGGSDDADNAGGLEGQLDIPNNCDVTFDIGESKLSSITLKDDDIEVSDADRVYKVGFDTVNAPCSDDELKTIISRLFDETSEVRWQSADAADSKEILDNTIEMYKSEIEKALANGDPGYAELLEVELVKYEEERKNMSDELPLATEYKLNEHYVAEKDGIQRIFMAACMEKALNMGTVELTKFLTEVYNKGYIGTDLTLQEMSILADFGSNMNLDDVTVQMVPGEATEYNGYSVWSIHKNATIDVINEYFRPYQPDLSYDSLPITELIESDYYTTDVYDENQDTLQDIADGATPGESKKKTTETSSSEESSYDGYDDYDYNQEENYGY